MANQQFVSNFHLIAPNIWWPGKWPLQAVFGECREYGNNVAPDSALVTQTPRAGAVKPATFSPSVLTESGKYGNISVRIEARFSFLALLFQGMFFGKGGLASCCTNAGPHGFQCTLERSFLMKLNPVLMAIAASFLFLTSQPAAAFVACLERPVSAEGEAGETVPLYDGTRVQVLGCEGNACQVSATIGGVSHTFTVPRTALRRLFGPDMSCPQVEKSPPVQEEEEECVDGPYYCEY